MIQDGAVAGAERLHRLAFRDATATTTPGCDPRALAASASAIASIQAMTARTLRHLSCHATTITPQPLRAALVERVATAADCAEHAHAAWVDVRAALRPFASARSGRSATATKAEAVDLVLRVGRVVHADPNWRRSVGNANRLREPADLAPHLPALAELLTAIHHIGAVSVLLAERQRQIVGRNINTKVLLVPTRTLDESDLIARRYSPAPEPVIASVMQTYAIARSATALAANALDAVQQLLPVPSAELGAQRALSHRRTAIEPPWQLTPASPGNDRQLMAVGL